MAYPKFGVPFKGPNRKDYGILGFIFPIEDYSILEFRLGLEAVKPERFLLLHGHFLPLCQKDLITLGFCLLSIGFRSMGGSCCRLTSLATRCALAGAWCTFPGL